MKDTMTGTTAYRRELSTLSDDALYAETRGKLHNTTDRSGSSLDVANALAMACWDECIRRGQEEIFHRAVESVRAERRAVRERNERAAEGLARDTNQGMNTV